MTKVLKFCFVNFEGTCAIPSTFWSLVHGYGALGNLWLMNAERFLWPCCRLEEISSFPELGLFVLHLRRRGLQSFTIEVQDAQSVLHLIHASLADEILTFYWLR